MMFVLSCLMGVMGVVGVVCVIARRVRAFAAGPAQDRLQGGGAGVVVVLTVLMAVGAASAQEGGGAFVEITPELQASVQRGLEYLAASQNADGSWGANNLGRHVGITGLACLAFMADGHTPGRGEYGRVIDRGLAFVLEHASESGLIAADTSHGPMYGHGFAAMFLGEVYGMSEDPRIRGKLTKAVQLIVNTQNNQGGWRYHPRPHDADISVTICQIMALRSAREAGIAVPKQTIDRAIEYVRQCQNPVDGGFCYMIGSGGSAFPRSAAGVASLYYAGVYEGEEIDRGLSYLHRQGRASMQGGGHYWYGQYYAAQAMFLAGGDHWERWFPMVREALLRSQQGDGSWQSNYGGPYATAMSLIILQVPNRYLPLFQR